MPPFSRHLLQQDIVNPFPGMVKLEQVLGHAIHSRIGSNESLSDPVSPLAAQFGPAMAELARLYPDPYALDLRQRVAQQQGVEADKVLFDTGADSLILLALRLCCDVGDTVVCTAGSYPTFSYFAQGTGVRLLEVPYHRQASGALRVDLAGLAAAAQREQARLVYIANPDNPTGHYWSAAEILALRQQLPESCWLLLDEAYIDFCHAEADAPPRGVMANTIRLRTLSKAYALAGLRVGYAMAEPEVIAKADQIRPQFGLSSFSQLAAQTVLDDANYSRQLIQHTVALRQQLSHALQQRGLNVLPSHTNFVCVAYADKGQSQAIQQALFAQGIAIHCPPHPATRHLLRITAHPDALQEPVLRALAQN